MLQFNHCLRPTAKELLSDPYFDNIRIKQNEIRMKKYLSLDEFPDDVTEVAIVKGIKK